MLYSGTDYRAILKRTIETRRELDRKFTFQRMAEHMRIQKAYLSKVIHGRAELSPDQLFLACEFLEFNEDEREYVELLLELARCAVKKRRDLLERKVHRFQARFLETQAHLPNKKLADDFQGLADYYLDPLHQIIHICLSVPRYQRDPGLLAHALEIKPERIFAAIRKLEQLGIITRSNNRYQVLLTDVHLPRDTPIYSSWRNQLKLLSMNRLQNCRPDRAYSFAVVFSANESARARIQERFLAFLKDVEPLVKEAADENAYQLSFDLFPWTEF